MGSSAVYMFSVAALILIAVFAMREHRSAIAKRHNLLAEAKNVLQDAEMRLAPDHFPIVSGRLDDGRMVRLELIPDTLVTRRLPQLWLKVTIAERIERGGPAIGALARPTGSEYYSLVHDLPEWLPPPEVGTPMLMRGDGKASSIELVSVASYFRSLFSDARVKEAVITPRATRLLYQAAEGERAAHLFLRQARFALDAVPAETIRLALLKATALSTVLATSSERPVVSEAA